MQHDIHRKIDTASSRKDNAAIPPIQTPDGRVSSDADGFRVAGLDGRLGASPHPRVRLLSLLSASSNSKTRKAEVVTAAFAAVLFDATLAIADRKIIALNISNGILARIAWEFIGFAIGFAVFGTRNGPPNSRRQP
jgi:hypothetical protein